MASLTSVLCLGSLGGSFRVFFQSWGAVELDMASVACAMKMDQVG